jgi:hypothetical protein
MPSRIQQQAFNSMRTNSRAETQNRLALITEETQTPFTPLLDRLVNPADSAIPTPGDQHQQIESPRSLLTLGLASLLPNSLLLPNIGKAEPGLNYHPTIRSFLEANPETGLALLVKKITQQTLTPFSTDQNNHNHDGLHKRIINVINHYDVSVKTEQTTQMREALENIARVSTTDCRDGGLGGFIEIEKHLANQALTSAVKKNEISAENLYGIAKKHFALQCIERKALTLCGALGSTREAVELALFLIEHLHQYIDLPIAPLPMQNATYARWLFNRAFMEVYPAAPLGLIDTTKDALAIAQPLFEKRIALIAKKIGQQLEDKQQVLAFMAHWAPARALASGSSTTEDSVREQTYEHLETIMALSQKPDLTPEDRIDVKLVLSFLERHKPCLPEGLFNNLALASARPGKLFVMTNTLTNDFAIALAAINKDLDDVPYRLALHKQFEHL